MQDFPQHNPSINIVTDFPIKWRRQRARQSRLQLNQHNNVTAFTSSAITRNCRRFPELQSFWRSKIHTRAQVVGGNWIGLQTIAGQ